MVYLKLINAILPTIIVVISMVAYILVKKKKLDRNFILFVIISTIGSIILITPIQFEYFRFVNGNWNWSGKIYIIVFSIICLFIFRNELLIKKVGLTFRQKPKSIKPALIYTIIFLSIISIGSLVTHKLNLPKQLSNEAILWNTVILPDFSEELFERGILLVLLNNFLSKKWNLFGAKIGIGFLFIILLFALNHGLKINNHYELEFNTFHFLRTFFVSGFTFTWLKERTGSLVFPTIAHFGSEFILTLVIIL